MYQAVADASQASQSDDESSKRSHFTLILPASPGIGLNDLRGLSSGTSLATGRPYRIIVNATMFFSTSETRLEKCVFASFTFIVNGICDLLSFCEDSLPNLGLLVNRRRGLCAPIRLLALICSALQETMSICDATAVVLCC
jgi:hypothetical protein